MSFYAISALVNFITSVTLGFFVIYKSRNSKNFSFFIFSLFVGFWSIAYFLWQISDTYYVALFWVKILISFAVFIPVAYLHFVYALIEILKRRKFFLIFSYFLFSFFLLANFTPYFVSHVEPLLNFKFWPIAGSVYSIFLIIWFFYVFYSSYLLIDKYRKSVGLIKIQIKYVIIGMIIGFTGGATNYLLWYKIPIPPFGNILVSVYVGSIAYAILRYRLMDIRIVVRKIFIYFGMGVFVYGAFYFLIWFYNKIFGGVSNIAAYSVGLIVAPAFILAFYGLDKWLRVFANKYLFVSLYNYQETINKLTEELNYYINLNKIIDLIVDTIKKTMQLERAGVLLVDPETKPVRYKISKVVGFNRQNGIGLVQDGFLTKHLKKSQKLLVRDELLMFARDARSVREKNNFQKLHKKMEKIEASLCLPLLSSNKLIGVIVLGSKISGDAYTKEDLELLNVLSKQAGIAIENAIMYQKVQSFSETLEEKVDEQTKELQSANKELKRLDEAKSEFLSIASHQLRTPLTVIKGYVSMMLEGSFGRIPKVVRGNLKKVFISTERLVNLVENLLDISRIEAGRLEFDIQPVDLAEISKFLIDDFHRKAKEKNLKLEFHAEKNLPKAKTDPDQIKEVISNFIDNAIKYTEQGKITVSLHQESRSVVFSCQDTGRGISPEDLSRLFNKFTRGQGMMKVHTEGVGLGLYFARVLIENMGGRIWAESPGKNKGSKFSFSLPLADKRQAKKVRE